MLNYIADWSFEKSKSINSIALIELSAFIFNYRLRIFLKNWKNHSNPNKKFKREFHKSKPKLRFEKLNNKKLIIKPKKLFNIFDVVYAILDI